jgi:hypothetical protein
MISVQIDPQNFMYIYINRPFIQMKNRNFGLKPEPPHILNPILESERDQSQNFPQTICKFFNQV